MLIEDGGFCLQSANTPPPFDGRSPKTTPIKGFSIEKECSAKLSVTSAPAAVPSGVFKGNPVPRMAQGALNEKLSTLLRHTH